MYEEPNNSLMTWDVDLSHISKARGNRPIEGFRPSGRFGSKFGPIRVIGPWTHRPRMMLNHTGESYFHTASQG